MIRHNGFPASSEQRRWMDRQYIINTGTIEGTDIVRASDGVKSTFVPDPASGCKYHVIIDNAGGC